jgi:hypothetical protein
MLDDVRIKRLIKDLSYFSFKHSNHNPLLLLTTKAYNEPKQPEKISKLMTRSIKQKEGLISFSASSFTEGKL